eukprot:CAMPEP_0117765176 /NCGR_PEP_ID=MMETSP0947-20121206/19934_1 /TAXON_ID=44440 /ORGANISM="Chattonella subsalsa, Strain CCMP2191" /LENGTH=115 /DNA_ID=CAMNT_0005587737 /DNA_START=30 /DNA_END=377 /DNA_ORIENTATION=-
MMNSMETEDQDGSKTFYSPEALQENGKIINYVRTSMIIVAGVVTGILGCTGLWGLLSFVGFYSLISLTLLVKMGMDPSVYTTNKSVLSFFCSDTQKYGLSFVLFWTLAYALVYIY